MAYLTVLVENIQLGEVSRHKWMICCCIYLCSLIQPVVSNPLLEECPVHWEHRERLTNKYGCNETHPLTCGKDQMGSLKLFCHREHLCEEPGTYPAVFTRDGQPTLQCQPCPEGWYQPYPISSPTSMSCLGKHEHPRESEADKYMLIKEGTPAESPKYSCKLGSYVNVNKEMYCQPYTKCLCAKLGEPGSLRCNNSNQDTLPDGSCSDKCRPGIERDKQKNFTCLEERPETTAGSPSTTSTRPPTNNTENSTSTLPTGPPEGSETGKNPKDENEKTVLYVILGVGVPVVIAGILLVFYIIYKRPKFFCCYCCNQHDNREYLYNMDKVNRVDVGGTADRNDGTHEREVMLQENLLNSDRDTPIRIV